MSYNEKYKSNFKVKKAKKSKKEPRRLLIHITKITLQKAAEKNIISTEQVEPLYQFIQEKSKDIEINDTDTVEAHRTGSLKFARSFGDVFITLGIVLILVAINSANFPGIYNLVPLLGFIGLAEWLVRVRRLVLPGIAILISILFFIYQLIPSDENDWALWGFVGISAASLLFYLRYNLPFSLFPFAASLVAIAILKMGSGVLENPVIFVGFGILIFAVAFWFDSRDVKRESYFSDNAFWLYLLASPLIVHGVMINLLFTNSDWLEPSIFMLVFFTFFFLLSLFIDRRVMLFSTQFYLVYALTQLYQENIDSGANALVYIFFGIGVFVIYFGAYWYKTRRLVFGFLRDSVVGSYVPDLNAQDRKIK